MWASTPSTRGKNRVRQCGSAWMAVVLPRTSFTGQESDNVSGHSLMPQRHHRIQPRCLVGRPDSEKYPHRYRYEESKRRRPEWHRGRPRPISHSSKGRGAVSVSHSMQKIFHAARNSIRGSVLLLNISPLRTSRLIGAPRSVRG